MPDVMLDYFKEEIRKIDKKIEENRIGHLQLISARNALIEARDKYESISVKKP